MWVYRTGMDDLPPVVLYDYQPGRNGEYPKKFLKGFHGSLHTDGYAGYYPLWLQDPSGRGSRIESPGSRNGVSATGSAGD